MVCKSCRMNLATFATGSTTGKSDSNLRMQPAQRVGNRHSRKQISIPLAASEDNVRRNWRSLLRVLKLMMHEELISH